MIKSKTPFFAGILSLPLMISGCGGGSSSGSDATGTFSLAITDGPVDDASKVVVRFTGVSVKPADGEAIEFDFADPKTLDLLQLQGSDSDSLLDSEPLTVGEYEWIRLKVAAEQDGEMDSYIEMLDGSSHELWVPSGSQSGLKLVNGFTVVAGGTVDFTIDFDLRKSITNPPGLSGMILKPVLRLVDNTSAGSIAGSVAPELVAAQCADASTDDGAVYAYSGSDVTPVDIQGESTDPIATSLVSFTEAGYQYELGFLPAGGYTIAYTCTTANDDPATDDSMTFAGTANVDVVADTQSTHDFPADAAVMQDPGAE